MTLLRDPRDGPLFRVVVLCAVAMLPLAAALYLLEPFPWWLVPVYWLVWLKVCAHPYGHLVHRLIHRPLFAAPFRFLDTLVFWGLGPVLGYTPTTFYVHHVAMHHREENLEDDLSSTMAYQRDSFRDFLVYFLRFMAFNTFELTAYLVRRGRSRRLVASNLAGDLAYYGGVAALLALDPLPTLVVFVVPFLMTRFVLAAINWTQHVFVDPDHPGDVFRNTVSTIDRAYNVRAFNEGYHHTHHLVPGTHYSELDLLFHREPDRYGKGDATVFDGIDFLRIWLHLMRRRHEALAEHFVRLPGAPERTDAEVVAMLRRRLEPIRTSQGASVTPERVASAPR